MSANGCQKRESRVLFAGAMPTGSHALPAASCPIRRMPFDGMDNAPVARGSALREGLDVLALLRFPYSTNVERVALALAHKGLHAASVWIDPADRSRVRDVSG